MEIACMHGRWRSHLPAQQAVRPEGTAAAATGRRRRGCCNVGGFGGLGGGVGGVGGVGGGSAGGRRRVLACYKEARQLELAAGAPAGGPACGRGPQCAGGRGRQCAAAARAVEDCDGELAVRMARDQRRCEKVREESEEV